MSLISRCTCRYMVIPPASVVPVRAAGTPRFAQSTALPHVLLLLRLPLLARTGVPRRKLDGLLGPDAALQLPSPFELGVELGAEQQREVGDPQPQEEDDDAGQ